MAIQIKAIKCPQCGSTDVRAISSTRFICGFCSAQFIVDEGNARKENEDYVETEPDPIKYEIHAEFSKKEFLRESWICLAAEDAPLEIFCKDFSEVNTVSHEVFVESFTAEIAYRAGIGYDRSDSFIDYDTYYEKQPYTDYEKRFNSSTGLYETHAVTKYNEVKKQRPITRYRTVTDWTLTNGDYTTDTHVFVENVEGQKFDDKRFLSNVPHIKSSLIEELPEEKAKTIAVSESTRQEANKMHANNITTALQTALPGDHNRDVSWKITKASNYTRSIYVIPEFESTIGLNGYNCTKRAFPFGELKVVGNKIKNSTSRESAIKQKKAEFENTKSMRLKNVDANVAKNTLPLSLATIGLLTFSIIVSLFARVTVLNVLFYLIALAAFIYNTIYVNRKYNEEAKLASDEIDSARAKMVAEIDAFSENYNKRQLDLLNEKLISLGLEPAKPEEIGG